MVNKIKKFFVGNYSLCWKFMKETRWFFVFAVGIFALTFLIGFAFPVFFADEIFAMIRGLMFEIEDFGMFEMISYILFNNLKASFFALLLGFSFGIFPFITCVVNGYLLGFVSHYSATSGGIFSLWRLFPHGIFELPAVILSIGIGFRIGVNLFGDLIGKKNFGVGYVLREGLRFFVFIVVPLLVVAGIIEGILVGIV